ncbi:MAG TPA: carboxypeptidase-like regulatory domain-containing protein [Acidobacteriaceae bacterium]|nr:carboxypeptidase-like regulatory domain-containing protein [Acidobacteriaceae bacterium]
MTLARFIGERRASRKRFAGFSAVFGLWMVCCCAVSGAQGVGSVSGSVIEVDGAAAAGAQVTLTGEALTEKRQATVDADGRFSFAGVPAGKFGLTVTADGFAAGAASGVVVAGQAVEVPQIILRVATANTDVEVNLSVKDLAEAEIRTEEKQRLFGFAPNFYVSYTFDAKPLTPKQKWELAYKSSIDPLTFAIAGGFAGIQQAENTIPEFGQGAAGYGKRYGTTYANVAIGNVLGGAVFPIIFRQDPRYFYKGVGTKRSRALYALRTAVIARGDNGKWQPAYAGLLAELAAAGISNAYYPAAERQGAALTFENAGLGIAFSGVGNLFQEFLFRKASSHAKASISKP